MFDIRKYNELTDFDTIEKWWTAANTKIWKGLLPETTYTVYENETPVVTACLYLMNSPNACMIENLVGNPDFDKEKRKVATRLLFVYLEEVAKQSGYKTIVLFSYESKLKDYYSSFGYTKTLDNVTTFSKEIGRE
jgi:predicted GNAT family N-acyltransferase